MALVGQRRRWHAPADVVVTGLLVAVCGWVAEQERTRLIERTQAGLGTRASSTLTLETGSRVRSRGHDSARRSQEVGHLGGRT